MGNILIIMAVILSVTAILTGILTENTGRNLAYTWALLGLGILAFSGAMFF